MSIRIKIGCVLVLLAAFLSNAHALDRRRLCEFGIEGGYGYYITEQAKYPFQDHNFAVGANFRYRFDQRWSILVHGLYLHNGKQKGPLGNVDVCADFNFFRFGEKSYDIRVKPITPYIFCGIGTNICELMNKDILSSIYIPFGVGAKWKFAPRWNLLLTWQNDIFIDQIIKKNPLNLYQAGAITLGVTVEFAKEKKICRICDQETKYKKTRSRRM